MSFAEQMEQLRELGDLQALMAFKARGYREKAPQLAARFERASFAAMNARLFMQAALMAEREVGK